MGLSSSHSSSLFPVGVMMYNQGNGAIGILSKVGALVRWGDMEADANHYWAEYITHEHDYVFTTTIVFVSYEVYEEMNESILAGHLEGLMGFPCSIEYGNHGFVHNVADMYVDWFIINE
jgi:hypothetical protein